MIVDEVELVGWLRDVESPRPEAFEQARTVLQAAIADDRPTGRLLPGRSIARAGRPRLPAAWPALASESRRRRWR